MKTCLFFVSSLFFFTIGYPLVYSDDSNEESKLKMRFIPIYLSEDIKSKEKKEELAFYIEESSTLKDEYLLLVRSRGRAVYNISMKLQLKDKVLYEGKLGVTVSSGRIIMTKIKLSEPMSITDETESGQTLRVADWTRTWLQ